MGGGGAICIFFFGKIDRINQISFYGNDFITSKCLWGRKKGRKEDNPFPWTQVLYIT